MLNRGRKRDKTGSRRFFRVLGECSLEARETARVMRRGGGINNRLLHNLLYRD